MNMITQTIGLTMKGHLNNFQSKYYKLLKEVKQTFPDFRLSYKRNHWWWYVLHYGMKFLTFGLHKGLLDNFYTTIGTTIYCPGSETEDRWNKLPFFYRYALLSHEYDHMLYCEEEGWLKFSLGYLFWPVPFFWPLHRRKVELRAFEISLKCYAERGRNSCLAYARQLVETLSGPSYGWMMRKKQARGWINSILIKLFNDRTVLV